MLEIFESRKALLLFILMATQIAGAAGASQIKIVEPEANATLADGRESVTVGISASSFAFNTSTITVPAGADVTVIFDNKDSGVQHNVAFYETKAANKPIYVGEIITGLATITYSFKAPEKPGTYIFRCDIHTFMSGDFVVI